MKDTAQRTILIGFLVFGLPLGCPDTYAGQKMAPLPELMRYQQEKEELLRDPRKAGAPHLVKNKIKILDGKISYLEKQLRPGGPQPIIAVAPEKPAPRSTPGVRVLQADPVAPAAMEKRDRAAEGVLQEEAVPRMKGVKTGADWKLMARSDKEIYILSVMGNLSRRDVFLEKSYDFYIDELDRRFKNEPALEKEYVHHVLLKSAFENEPESRKDIEKVWK